MSQDLFHNEESLLELIEFTVERHIGGQTVSGRYGVNVSKVREVVRMPPINPLASNTPSLAGIFQLRSVPILAVHLAKFLGDENASINPQQKIIVTEFSKKRAGFIVDATKRIRKIPWNQIMPPSADAGSAINGMALIEKDEFLFILDLERILAEIEERAGYKAPSHEEHFPMRTSLEDAAGIDKPLILLVDDSDLVRKNAKLALTRGGFDVLVTTNGLDALRTLEKNISQGEKQVCVVVSDIEMPKMDGITLARKIRANPQLKHLPIIFHSSLSGHVNQDAALAAGGNAYCIKNDNAQLIKVTREFAEKASLRESA